MAMTPLRDNVALAIDGGGIRGLIVAKALIALEHELGGKPLIEHPQIKVLAGTSTGAIISAGIAAGLNAEEITHLYINAGRLVFPALLPTWVPSFLSELLAVFIRLFRPALYTGHKLRELLRATFAEKTGNPDLTLRDLRARLRDDQVLLITAVNINERRTHFLKSYDEKDGDWMVWEAVMASSAAPTLLPVIRREDSGGKQQYFTDGGVGSYGNPGYIAAREAIEWRGYAPEEVSVLSFGTGWVNAENFERARGRPNRWRILAWAMNALLLMLGDAARAQSLDIIHDFVRQGLDFRRFQVGLEQDIAMDDASEAAMTRMEAIGEALGGRILNDQHALGPDPNYDPEGLRSALERFTESIERSQRQMRSTQDDA